MGYLEEKFNLIKEAAAELKRHGVTEELVLVIPYYETSPENYATIEGIDHVELNMLLNEAFIVMQRSDYLRNVPHMIIMETRYEEELKIKRKNTVDNSNKS